MSTNFKISTCTVNGNLHLELKGDFDGSSACELANIIMLKHDKNRQVIINCEKLGKIFPFGSSVFGYLMKSSLMPADKMIFEGGKESEIKSLRYNLLSPDKEKGHDSESHRCVSRCSIM